MSERREANQLWRIKDGDFVLDKTGIIFPVLNGLTPTIESCTFKMLEEAGEVFQMLGKGQKLSGEGSYAVKQVDELGYNILLACEAMDLAQSAVTMVRSICSHYGIILEDVVMAHEAKLREKGYLL